MLNKFGKGYGILFAGVLLSIIPYLVTDYVFHTYPETNIANIATWSFLSVSIFLSPFFLSTKKQRKLVKKEWQNNHKLLLKIVLLTGVGAALWFYSIKFGTAGIVAFLKKSDIIFVMILGQFFLQERISKQELIGTIIAISGFILMSYSVGQEISPWAIAAIVGTQVFFSLQSFFVKRDAKDMQPFIFSWLRIFGMGCVFLIASLSTNALTFVPIPVLLIFASGQLFGGFLYRVAYFEAHKHLEISKISIFLLMAPVLTLLSSWMFLDESIHTEKLIGAAIILIGLIIFSLGRILKRKVKNKHKNI